MVKYIPHYGDIIYINLNPIVGHEQSGWRPAVVISKDSFNDITGMAIVCPITTNIKDFPTHFILDDSKKIKGAALIEHIRSIDFSSREVKFIEKMSERDLKGILYLLLTSVSNLI